VGDLESLSRLASVSRQHDRGKGPEIHRVNAHSEPEEASFGQYTQFGVFLAELVLVFGNGLGVQAHRVKPSNDFRVFLADFILIFGDGLGIEPRCVKLSSDFRVFLPALLLLFGDGLGIEA